jgi:hypothetical protein
VRHFSVKNRSKSKWEMSRRRATSSGQAMLLVIALIGFLVAVPAAVDLLAANQNSNTNEAGLVIQAKQAALAGISDYINHVQADSTYMTDCSNSVFTGLTGCTTPANNPAFVNVSSSGNTWLPVAQGGVTMPGPDSADPVEGKPTYHYVVDPAQPTVSPQLVTVYSTGQAGTQLGEHVSVTEEAALTICSGGSGCVAPPTGVQCQTVPQNAYSAQVTILGAEGGGGETDALAGVGAQVTATFAVRPGDKLDLVPGQMGVPGDNGLLGVLGLTLFPGTGGTGGSATTGCASSSLPDLSGGNGSVFCPTGVFLSTACLAAALKGGGGGGGGATSIYDEKSSTVEVVAGGGGGGGAGNLVTALAGDPLLAGLNALLPVLQDFPGPGGNAGSITPVGVTQPTAGAPGGPAPGITLLGLGTGLFYSAGGLGAPRSTGSSACVSGKTSLGCGQSAASSPINAITGGGGGGGGGYSGTSQLGGGAAGTTGGGLLTIVNVAAAGGGGGAGASYANSCGNTPSFGLASYPSSDTTKSGLITSIAYYAGGTYNPNPLNQVCGANPLTAVTGTVRAASAP